MEHYENGKDTTHQSHIVKYPMKIVSFLRIGEVKNNSRSKSKIMNEVISDEGHDYFFHYDCSGGQYNCILGDGLVDVCWHLPSLKPTDLSTDPVTFLNLHGDARKHDRQVSFLGQISTLCCLLITDENLNLEEQIQLIISTLSKSPGGVIFLDATNGKSEILKTSFPNSCIINVCQNVGQIKHNIRRKMKISLQQVDHVKSIEELSCLSENMKIDEKQDEDYYIKGKSLVDAMIKIIHAEKMTKRDEILPLQGQNWKNWASTDKELHRGTMKGSQSINKHAEICKRRMKDFRQLQQQQAEKLTQLMDLFVNNIQSLAGDSNFMARNYFLKFLKLELNYISSKAISNKQHQFRSLRNELSALDSSTNSDKKKKKRDECQNSLISLQKEIIDSSLGLEHLFRELGQLFEATQLPLTPDTRFTNLPKLAAEILRDGYPLEIMDGDSAHVPLKWVDAVLLEADELLGKPKIFVFSVLGIQSTGKSTMLNTTFGLDFNVSAGRCTRGAFMQLLPLDKELQKVTKCTYLLIIDTEGLRAPEQKAISMHKHDNELATFVIGLANMTLINIYGEVTGDMDDILQTSVHAFLRMKNVKLYPSCKFIHQNAGASINCELGRENLRQKLNACASAAARTEGKGNVELFKDVIRFNDQDDIHYFPGLWKGDPPMAPINHGYSQASQKLKSELMKVLCERTGKICLTKQKLLSEIQLTDFSLKVRDIWDSLLQENFVFSFRNTLEIIAYNSLEIQYCKWEWKFQEAMLHWELKAANEIKTESLTAVSTVSQSKCLELKLYTAEMFGSIQKEMDTYFEDKDLIGHWKSNFETKLNHLRNELMVHAVDHCKKLCRNTAMISKFQKEKDNETYTRLITQEVQKFIENNKKDQEILQESLQHQQLTSQQLEYLLKRKVFDMDKLLTYEQQTIISHDQLKLIQNNLEKNREIITEKEIEINLIVSSLQRDQIIRILKTTNLTDSELRDEFEKIWKEFIDNNLSSTESFVNLDSIKDQVETVLGDHVKAADKHIIREKLRSKSLAKRSEMFKLDCKKESDKRMPYKLWGVFTIGIRSLFHTILHFMSDDGEQTNELTQNVVEKIKQVLDKIMKVKTDFKPAYTKLLLQSVDEVIDKKNLPLDFKHDLYLAVCEYAIPQFELMAKSFRELNDPLIYLEKNVKGPLFTQFKNQCQQTKAEEGIASMLCAYLEEPILAQVDNVIGINIVNQMMDSDSCFSSKMDLKVKVLTDLYQEDSFESYTAYLTDVKSYLEKKIEDFTLAFCDEESDSLSGITRLQAAAEMEVSRLIRVVERVVASIEITDIHKWLLQFSSSFKLRQEIGESIQPEKILVGYDSLDKLNLENFKKNIELELEELKQQKLLQSIRKIECIEAMKNWKTKPYKILEKIIGCTKQCPFCGEQCDLQIPDHESNYDHRIHIHRINCLAGWRWTYSSVMLTDVCQAVICTDSKFKISSGEYHPYKDYRAIHTKWKISADPSSEASLYWKWFVGKYSDRIADHYKAKPPDIPEEWLDIKWPDIERNLKVLYHIR